MSHLDRYFSDSSDYSDLSESPHFLGHIAELGWVLNDGLLDRRKDTGIFVPTKNWIRRGELSAAVFMTFLNIHYNKKDQFRQSQSLFSLFPKAVIAVHGQFLEYREFRNMNAGPILDYFNDLFGAANAFYDDPRALAVTIGLQAQSLEENETNAMIRLSGYCEGLLRTFYDH